MLACAKSSCKHHSHLNQQRVTFKLLKTVFVTIFELLIKVPFGSFQQRDGNKTGFVLARNRRTVTRIRHPEKCSQRNNPVSNLTRDFFFFLLQNCSSGGRESRFFPSSCRRYCCCCCPHHRIFFSGVSFVFILSAACCSVPTSAELLSFTSSGPLSHRSPQSGKPTPWQVVKCV